MKSLKTPLRYPGGKSRATVKLCQWLPNDITEYREPFLGGGSMAIEITKRYPNIPIWVNDLYEPLYNFWIQLQCNGEEMSRELKALKTQYDTPDKAKELFSLSKEKLNDSKTTNEERGVAFYVINKCSFSGLTEGSSFSSQASEQNFSLRGIEKLPAYEYLIKEWKITNLDYAELGSDEDKVFIYADPPYDIKDALYGHKGDKHRGFDHARFADIMDEQLCNVMISYNNDEDIIQRFLEWSQYDYAHTYTMRSTGTYMSDQTKRRELICLNYGSSITRSPSLT